MPHPKLFFLALGYYTRLPCPPAPDYRRLPEASVFLPAIGWLVGGLSAAAFALADLVWPQTVAVLAALIAGILLTGAFHEDGFADVCDGFGGGYGKQRILAIMKDSAIGVYGTLGILLLLLLKISLLGSMPSAAVPSILLAGHSLSRLMPLLLMHRYRYAREETSKGGAAAYRPALSDLVFASGLALIPFAWLPAASLAAVPPVLIAALWLGRYCHRHIGGYTGDCLGACQQVAESVFYLSISALWTFI
ncbi:adenosylcobinamide-GDP ribazoletransferase [Methylosarcina fibrata]|uniref:adenosylcobinamide-GDP ribazoletransferase n=1 Tax=Methylosarcina fibrata TaxID=105972 RepID=UPI0003A26F2C|nr:adenosylcobinamide-GDP ribazoletransferase [Methylosarcina fibrata]